MTPPAPRQPWRWGDAIRWVLYDVGSTAYAMVVLALVFPRMFHTTWGASLPPEMESVAYKVTQAVPCLLVFVLAPFLGQLAGSPGFRARGLRLAAVLGAALMGGIGFLGEGDWLGASLLYAASAAAFYIAATLYDSMLVDCAPPGRRHVLSGAGFSAGFLSGTVILLILASGAFAGRIGWVYPGAGLWWLALALPLFLRDPGPSPVLPPLRDTWRETVATGREIWAKAEVRWFLLGFILYIDGVHAVKTTATHLGSVLGFGTEDLIKAFLVAQVVGVPARRPCSGSPSPASGCWPRCWASCRAACRASADPTSPPSSPRGAPRPISASMAWSGASPPSLVPCSAPPSAGPWPTPPTPPRPSAGASRPSRSCSSPASSACA